jgi:hypothetical protein
MGKDFHVIFKPFLAFSVIESPLLGRVSCFDLIENIVIHESIGSTKDAEKLFTFYSVRAFLYISVY